MPRSMWSGAISFGLVNVPVRLFTAVQPKDVRFHLLHDEDGVRLQQKRVCPADGKEIPWEHVVKGYEIAPNQYVRIEPKELEALDPKATHTIDIQQFVEQGEIDPLFYENSYYLLPDKGAGKAYSLLLTAMRDTEKIAIAKFVMRTKQYIVAVRPKENVLSMSTLYYADEVVSQEDLEGVPEKEKLNARELDMAKKLVESLSDEFDPAKFHDEYRDRVLELIRKKSEGEEIVTQPAAPESKKVINLMDALQASLSAAKKGPARKGEARTRHVAPSARPAAHRHPAVHRRKRSA